ncbi:MAG: glycosyltransferase family 4 protein [Chloroflexales bacterium]|nr:glycosyltransferase family 4 protein [Chloroflexales bacterium]
MSIRALCIAFGSEELTSRLAIALADEGEVCLMLPESPLMPGFDWAGLNVDFQPFAHPRLRQPARQARCMAALVERIRRFNPDVIHLQKGHMYFSLALPFLREFPLVISIHDPKHHPGDRSSGNHLQWLLDLGYRRADQIIVHNEPMQREVMRRLGLPEEKIQIVPLIERGDATIRPEVREAGNEILFFGRIWRYKGLDYLIRAAPLIRAAIPDARIVIAGTGEDFQPYAAMMADPAGFIVYNEFISHERQAELFRRASVVALPYSEATQSGVIPVAYTFGKPVVATTVGGLASQVVHEQTGLLVPPCDERALADAIIRLMRDPQLRQRLGAGGKRKLEAEWAAPVVARQTLPVYRRAIDSAGARRPARRTSYS